jgi:uncharacterized protein (TIGR04255 family)
MHHLPRTAEHIGTAIDAMAPKYAQAPIAEAVIDIRAAVATGVSVDSLAGLARDLAPRFQSSAPIQNFQMGVRQEAGQSASFHTAQAVIGVRLQNADASRVLQLKVDGFTYSWLSPYESWEAFRAEAEELWNLFREVGRPTHASRLAIRTINRINLDERPPVSLKQYFNIRPSIPDELGEFADAFFVQLQIKMEECSPGSRAIINFAGNETSPDVSPEIVLDLDVFLEEEVDVAAGDMWPRLEGLRHCKNRLFESCITDELRKVIA